MIFVIIILCVLLGVAIPCLIYCAYKIYILEKNIEILKQHNSSNSNDIKNLMLTYMSLVASLREASELDSLSRKIFNSKIKGEA